MPTIHNPAHVRRPPRAEPTASAASSAPSAPATVPSPPAGLDAATDAGGAPRSGGSAGVGADAPGRLPPLFARGHVVPRESLFALAPGGVSGAVGLDVVLEQLGRSAEGQRAVRKIIEHFEGQSGVRVNPALVNAALANPARLVDVLQVSPRRMSEGVDALNAAHRAGHVPATAPKERLLPKTFDLAQLHRIDFARPQDDLKELAPGLWRGDLKNEALSDEQAKQNVVMAEVFDRLAENATLPASERFAVRYGASTFTRVDTFVAALRRDGYEVKARVEQRVANFAALFTRAPDGSLLDVPAPLMVTVDRGDGAVPLPSIHSQVVYSLTPGRDTRGPKLSADVKWYQGVPNTGFFPDGLMRTPPWLGGNVSDTLEGDDAARAMALSALLSDVINTASAKAGLAMNGYGVTGVCNDSVAIIQQAMTGRVSSYPLLMRDEAVVPELERRISDANNRDNTALGALKDSIEAVPSDVNGDASSIRRALTSLPWARGEEPLASTAAARATLERVAVVDD